MKFYISEPEPRDSGAILVCDESHNDIAEFFHNEHATVEQSYETALALAKQLVEGPRGVAQAAWQPIETAPRDGTDILVWPYWSDRQPAQVHWRDMKRTPGRWEVTPSFYCYSAAPTHWMPLPEPPCALSSTHAAPRSEDQS